MENTAVSNVTPLCDASQPREQASHPYETLAQPSSDLSKSENRTALPDSPATESASRPRRGQKEWGAWRVEFRAARVAECEALVAKRVNELRGEAGALGSRAIYLEQFSLAYYAELMWERKCFDKEIRTSQPTTVEWKELNRRQAETRRLLSLLLGEKYYRG